MMTFYYKVPMKPLVCTRDCIASLNWKNFQALRSTAIGKENKKVILAYAQQVSYLYTNGCFS